MARKQQKGGSQNKARGKIGSDPKTAKEELAKGDFGVSPENRVETAYAARRAKHQDPGGMNQRLQRGDGARESGVGASVGGRGAGSGGDLDTDIIGVGTGGSGISQNGPDDRVDGPDMTTVGGSEPFAAPGPKGHRNAQPSSPMGRGSTVDRSGGDVTTTGDGAGAGAVTNPDAETGDAFAGEISDSESRGGDNTGSDRG